MNSKNLSQAHVQAADILTELYSNLKEDQVLLFQMSSAIWRKVGAHDFQQSCTQVSQQCCTLNHCACPTLCHQLDFCVALCFLLFEYMRFI